MKQLKKAVPLSSALEQLTAQGYHIADETIFFDQPAASIQSTDWRLDLVQPTQEEGRNVMVIAVSSPSRRLKVVFVEYVTTIIDFWPTDLLQKLFPKRKP
ncbi:MAG: hypothetical protein RIQ78_1130 [Bacteroidota bacterium]